MGTRGMGVQLGFPLARDYETKMFHTFVAHVDRLTLASS